MTTAEAADVRVIGEVTQSNRYDLRKTLRYAYDKFGVYRRSFDAAGIAGTHHSGKDQAKNVLMSVKRL